MRSLLIFACILGILASACAPSYMPNLTNTPLLYQKGDYIVGTNYSDAGIDLQGGLALNNSVGAITNISAAPFTGDKYFLGEAGLGYYKVLAEEFHVELFGGAGFGYGNASEDVRDSTFTEKGSYFRYFIQPDIGFHSKLFEFAFACRLANVQYLSFEENGVEPATLPSAWVYEPTISIRFGFGGDGFFENKKIAIVIGGSFFFEDDPGFESEGSIGGLGLIFRNRGYDDDVIR